MYNEEASVAITHIVPFKERMAAMDETASLGTE